MSSTDFDPVSAAFHSTTSVGSLDGSHVSPPPGSVVAPQRVAAPLSEHDAVTPPAERVVTPASVLMSDDEATTDARMSSFMTKRDTDYFPPPGTNSYAGVAPTKRRFPWGLIILSFFLFTGWGVAAKSIVDNRGPSGTQGVAGVAGPRGATGGQGPAGADGVLGQQGERGSQGVTGTAGASGAAGAQGEQGPSGIATCPNGVCLSLQPATPGVPEAGSINITGTLIANTLQGDGTNITNVNAVQLGGNASSYYTNASNIGSGTLANGRLSSSVTLQGNTFNGISQLVETTAGGELPALSGANLTGLNGSNISSGTVSNARLSAGVTLQGNVFNGASQLVQLDGVGALPALGASALTALNASSVSSGTLSDTRLSGNVTLQGNSFNGTSQLVQLDVVGALPSLNAAALTSLSASSVSSGSLADARLTSNVALLDRSSQSFTGSGALFKNSADSATAFRIQNAAATTTVFVADTSAGRVGIGAAPSYTLDVAGDINSSGKVRESGNILMPVGTVLTYAGSSTPPGGWLACDGSAVSRTTYASLFSAIGTTFGAGNGSTTFNVPDMRGRVAVGTGQGSGLTNRTLAGTGGEETHTQTTNEMPSHSHSTTFGVYDINGVPTNPGSFFNHTGATNDGLTATITGTSSSTGGGQAFNVMQPFIAFNSIIKY